MIKELSVKCTLYFDLHKNESVEEALERLQEQLNDNDIAAQFYGHEVRELA